MAQYSKSIASGNNKYEFWFTEISEPAYVRVFITVEDANRRLICFNMKRHEHKYWKIIEATNLPIWIIALENELSNCIDGSHTVNNQITKSLKR